MSYEVLIRSVAFDVLLKRFAAALEEPDEFGATPLIAAINSGNLRMFKELLKLGADIHHETFQSPMGTAIDSPSKESNEMLEILLGLDPPTLKNHWKFCPELFEPLLHATIRRGFFAKTKILLKHGAQLDWLDDERMSAVDLAKSLGVLKHLQEII